MLKIKAPVIPRPYTAPIRTGKRFTSLNGPRIEELRCYFGETDPVPGPVALHLEFGIPIPKYLLKRMAKHGLSHCDKKPDLSNYIKLAEDAAKGHLFEDDAKVVVITAMKAYVLEPYTLIEVRSASCTPTLDPQYNPC